MVKLRRDYILVVIINICLKCSLSENCDYVRKKDVWCRGTPDRNEVPYYKNINFKFYSRYKENKTANARNVRTYCGTLHSRLFA